MTQFAFLEAVDFDTHAPSGEAPIPLNQKNFTIGRKSANDYTISNSAISGVHCTIKRKRGLYFLIDTSTNGTYVNGKRLLRDREHQLQSRDLIAFSRQIAKLMYRFQNRQPPAVILTFRSLPLPAEAAEKMYVNSLRHVIHRAILLTECLFCREQQASSTF